MATPKVAWKQSSADTSPHSPTLWMKNLEAQNRGGGGERTQLNVNIARLGPDFTLTSHQHLRKKTNQTKTMKTLPFSPTSIVSPLKRTGWIRCHYVYGPYLVSFPQGSGLASFPNIGHNAAYTYTNIFAVGHLPRFYAAIQAKWGHNICRKRDGTVSYYVKQNKPDLQRQMPHGFSQTQILGSLSAIWQRGVSFLKICRFRGCRFDFSSIYSDLVSLSWLLINLVWGCLILSGCQLRMVFPLVLCWLFL